MESSRFLYYSTKYFFTYMIALMLLGEFKDGDLDVPPIEAIFLLVVFGLLQIIMSRLICRASVDEDFIETNCGKSISWAEVKSINRWSNLYILRLKNDWVPVIFPVEKLATIFNGGVSYTKMDQLIRLKKRQLKI